METKVDVEDTHINIMLLGKTGHGKSSTANSILMRKDFQVADSAISVTPGVQVGATQIGVQKVVVIDTQGLCDTANDPKNIALEKTLSGLSEGMAQCLRGVDCFILVLNYANSRFTEEESSTVETLKDIFGEDMFRKYLIIVFTHKAEFENKQASLPKNERVTWDTWCSQQKGGLQDLFVYCKNRIILFENLFEVDEYTGEPKQEYEDKREQQRRMLLRMIHQMSREHMSGRYTSSRFQEAYDAQQARIEEANFEVISPAIQNHLGILRAKLRESLTTKSGDELLMSLDQIKDDGKDLLEQISKQKNTSRVFDGISETVQDFIDNANNKVTGQHSLLKMNEDDSAIRRLLASGTGFITSTGASAALFLKAEAILETAVMSAPVVGAAGATMATTFVLGALVLGAGQATARAVSAYDTYRKDQDETRRERARQEALKNYQIEKKDPNASKVPEPSTLTQESRPPPDQCLDSDPPPPYPGSGVPTAGGWISLGKGVSCGVKKPSPIGLEGVPSTLTPDELLDSYPLPPYPGPGEPTSGGWISLAKGVSCGVKEPSPIGFKLEDLKSGLEDFRKPVTDDTYSISDTTNGESMWWDESDQSDEEFEDTPQFPDLGQQYRAAWDYTALQDDEMSFRAGDVILVTCEDPSGWWTGYLEGNEGFVPGNYLEKI